MYQAVFLFDLTITANFEVSLHFWQSWPTVCHRRSKEGKKNWELVFIQPRKMGLSRQIDQCCKEGCSATLLRRQIVEIWGCFINQTSTMNSFFLLSFFFYSFAILASTVFPDIVSDFEQFPSLDSFRSKNTVY